MSRRPWICPQLIGGPVLDNHDRFTSVRAVLGVATAAGVDGKRGMATVQFSERPEVQGIARDVQQGIIRSVSAGYTVQAWQTGKTSGWNPHQDGDPMDAERDQFYSAGGGPGSENT